MNLIDFDNTNHRGPSSELWGGIVDWVSGRDALQLAATYIEDFHPYLGDDVGIALSGDTGGAAAVQAEPYGIVTFDADQAADAVAGFNVDLYVDLDISTFSRFGMEVRMKVVDDSASTQTFIGLTDEALDGFFGTDNTPDGSSFGLRWNSDETVDLVSIASDDTITVVIDEIGTVERTVGYVRFGFVAEKHGSNYECRANLSYENSDGDLVVHTKTGTTTTVPGAAMKPAIIHTNDNEAAPDFDADWVVVYNKSAV